ncbi:hypothetical protein BDB00DRAFT_816098 [Zychaea mexicana]|uniref:uncharacterized protein n=1 Tax=Zychaea mexicana TaxID=64656 RepID=UPI0022FEA999|nr:uncharacterized protein BDB00DRAFT_816098 [Zychaea mexicana]KAI9494856.1 hypothetical protein BDB00DRAFT_816098 [Zychaea mexicana]
MKLRDLPPEILSLTLQTLQQPDLYQCIFVNRRFNAAAIQHLWRAPTIRNHARFKQFVKCLRSSKKPVGSWVRQFRIDWQQQQDQSLFDDDDCLLLLPHVPQLEDFAVQNSDRLTDKSISSIANYCSQLEILYLKRADITYRSAHHLGMRCKKLRKLTFDHCRKLQSMALLPFADCPLEYLDLSGCKWINVEDTAYDMRAFKRLRHLDIVCSDKTAMMNDFLLALARDEQSVVVMPDLMSFSVTGCNEIGDNAAIRFIEAHPQLEYLTLMACGITDLTLDAIQRHLPRLLYLDISFCQSVTMGGVRRLIRGSRLQMIGLKACGLRKFQFPEVPRGSDLLRQTQVDIFNEAEINLIRTYPDDLPQPLFDDMPADEVVAQFEEEQEQQGHHRMQIDPPAAEVSDEEEVAAVYVLIHQSLEANLL